MSLPDCMMTDGGDACAAYHELVMENATLKAENDRLREALELILKTLPDEFDDAMLWHVVTIAKQALGGNDE